MWREILKIEKLPKNVCLRISSPNIDQKPLKGFKQYVNSTHENKKAFGLNVSLINKMENV